jgi:Uma2 family endonuclease
MKAVMLEVDAGLLEQRRRLGLDRKDEMWEGVLHMTPAPANEHQRILDELLFFLMGLLRRTGRGTVRSGINVFDESSPAENYRVPDLTFVARERDALFHDDGIRGGGPDAVVEVRSPHDESYDKLPFFAKLGVTEVIVIDRDTKNVEVFALTAGRYEARASSAGGVLVAETLGVEFHTLGGARPRLRVVATADPSVEATI